MILTGVEKDEDLAILKAKLLGSLLFFTQFFFKLQTGREFIISEPEGRESHYITVCRHLTRAFRLETNRIFINIPPGHGKSTLLSYFIAWAFAHFPDCRFIYVSYAHDLATKHTYNVKSIINLAIYKTLFGVSIAKDSSAKDDFSTEQGGAVKAFGSAGAITGQDAGLPGLNRFTGCVILDDMHKPIEIHSDKIRQSVIDNYNQTIKQRPRSPNVPIIAIGQRLHEDDIFRFWIDQKDGSKWDSVILKDTDEAGNILCPLLTPRAMLEREKKYNPYVYAAQYQQDPAPAGGGIFKADDFYLLDEEPQIISTFITVDTAETDKDYNDPCAFSFWGLYKIADNAIVQDEFALQWIDCYQDWIDAANLENEFNGFYRRCLMHKVKPSFVAIEKKSTGVTLASTLSKLRGLKIISIDRTKASGSKTARYLEIQPYISRKLISFHRYAKHVHMCIEHCKKITANNTHAHDDIADNLYDAVKIGLIDPFIINNLNISGDKDILAKKFNENYSKLSKLRSQRWQR